MWVSAEEVVGSSKFSLASLFNLGFTHNLSHKLKALNLPLTWSFSVFPQEKGLVTTTTHNYLERLMRFLLGIFQNFNYLEIKDLQTYSSEGRLTK